MIPIATNLQRRKFPIATVSLISCNVLFFIVEILLPEGALRWVFQHLGFGPATRNPFAPFVSMFLHGSVYHIAFNMLFLWIFGGPVEERIGVRNFLIYYFGAGLAGGFLNVVMEVIAHPGSTVPAIGASGAISGVMALFLYRCFYSKLKLVISPILLPRQISIPVIPLVLFWFFQNVILGIFSFSFQTGVAHWAHVGGFIFGIAVGRIKRYGHEGQVEQLREEIWKSLEAGGGWMAAEKDLLKLFKIAPDDPEVNHDLARLYAGNNQPKKAERHFKTAVQRYFISDPVAAAYTVREHLDTLSAPMELQYHLKAAEVLVGINDLDDACKLIMPVLSMANNKNSIVERSLALLIKVCHHLGKEAEAFEAVRILMENFPNSRYRDEVRAVMLMKSGEVLSPAKPVSDIAASEARTKERREAERLSKIELFERFFADPVFWTLLLFVNIAAPILFPRLCKSQLSPVYLFVAAFVMTVGHRIGSISGILSYMSGPSEKKALEQFNLKRSYDEALLAEKRGLHAEAIALYEKFLAADQEHIQARFNLAELYNRKLKNVEKARPHYKVLLRLVPQEHPFYRDAIDALKELRIS
jgi:membrane associated rhomboid family serine protease/Tfp pilus assembly protein PilF